MTQLRYLNTAGTLVPHVHGMQHKTLGVVHETVSGDIPGWKDITSIEAYLASKDYGIHGMTDADGNCAWGLGLGKAVFWQAGGVNEESIGIEQVSNIMLRSPSNAVRRKLWVARNKQLRATAKLIACIEDAQGIPIKVATWNGHSFEHGWVGHWNVSQHYPASEGHSDCWPVNDGGYYPLGEVLSLARGYAKLGYHF